MELIAAVDLHLLKGVRGAMSLDIYSTYKVAMSCDASSSRAMWKNMSILSSIE